MPCEEDGGAMQIPSTVNLIPAVSASSQLTHKAPPGSPAQASGPADAYVGPAPVAAPSSEGSRRTGLRVAAGLALGLVGLGLLGCTAQLGAAPPPAVTCVSQHYQATGDFTVEVIPEGVHRVDVMRGTHTVTEKDIDGKEVTRTVDNDYHPVGVYLGDGLFYDLNENLVMVSDRIENGPYVPAEASRINIDPPGWSNSTDVSRSGSSWTVDPPGWSNSTSLGQDGCRISIDPAGWNNSTSVTRDAQGRTVIDRTGWANEIVLTRSADQVQVDPSGIGNTVTIRLSEGRTEIDPPGFGNSTVITHGPGQSRVDPEGWANETVITRDGNVVRVRPSGVFAQETTITLGKGEIRVDPPGWNNETTIRY